MANTVRFKPESEWLEADGLGGFASGTVAGWRTRRYHALLLAATRPPTGRQVLVNGFDAWVETPSGSFALSSQRYAPDVVHPDGAQRLDAFAYEPWPRWTFRLDDGTRIEQQICVRHGEPLVAVWWSLVEPRDGVRLLVRPFLSGRDYHSMHHENGSFAASPDVRGQRLRWEMYPGVAPVTLLTNATYEHAPVWFRNFLYSEERDRGLDATEDLMAPGTLRFDLSNADAMCVLGTTGSSVEEATDAVALVELVRADERERRARFASAQQRAADAYLVRRGAGRSIVAGYPWFTDWGRDTFIAMRGLCVATGRLDEALDILVEWSGSVSDGMLPNRFPDAGEEPEFNSVDASLWYVIVVHEVLQAMERAGRKPRAAVLRKLQNAVHDILTGYTAGTRFGIHATSDGLLAAGAPGWQLTWMDAKIGDHVITPRIGKPVEVQALWLNALWIAGTTTLGGSAAQIWTRAYEKAHRSFQQRFWNGERGILHDVVDVDHVAKRIDATLRPNQIFAVGGLPRMLLDMPTARRVVDAVESALWTPIGLRSLAPGENGYVPRYAGGVLERDSAYHQGTVWPWLIGAFVEAWVRVRGSTTQVHAEARRRFLHPFRAHLEEHGLGHVSEITDAEPPHIGRGCPFQAWSLGELLRLELDVLVDAKNTAPPRGKASSVEVESGSSNT